MVIHLNLPVHNYHHDIIYIRCELGVGLVGYSTRTRRVIVGRVSDRKTRVLGPNHLSV